MNYRKYLYLIIGLFIFIGCDKAEEIERYKADFGQIEPWEEGTPVELKTGIVDAQLRVGTSRREFRYFMPSTLKDSDVSLVICLHGHMPYMPENPYNPVGGFNEYDKLSVLAKTENIIVVHPVGALVDDLGVFGWNDEEANCAFIDKLIKYFSEGCPALNPKRVYATGVSSGAIFCYSLARFMSDKIAAVVPVSGQYSIQTDFVMPGRAVPIRNYSGTADDAVDCDASYANHFTWANTIAGCKLEDKVVEDITISEGWYSEDIEVTRWEKGTAPMEFYKVWGGTHSLNLYLLYPSIWEFMKANPIK